jgi:short-subunit dehydrogenase
MKTAIVTGASSGIGLSISKRLLEMGFRVYGLSRSIQETDFTHTNLIKLNCNVSDTRELSKTLEHIKDTEEGIHVLVNNAGIGYFGPHEQIKPIHIEQMVTTNLLAPLIATNLLLRELRKTKGFIINISSVTAKKSSTHGAAYAATKAGLSHFAVSLFDETRKSGIKVVTIHPDMTKTNFYNNADFKEGSDPESYITAECVSDAVEYILNQRIGTVISDITIKPQKHMIERK